MQQVGSQKVLHCFNKGELAFLLTIAKDIKAQIGYEVHYDKDFTYISWLRRLEWPCLLLLSLVTCLEDLNQPRWDSPWVFLFSLATSYHPFCSQFSPHHPPQRTAYTQKHEHVCTHLHIPPPSVLGPCPDQLDPHGPIFLQNVDGVPLT